MFSSPSPPLLRLYLGAPHVLDEGFGAYHGNASDCAPWAYAEEAAAAFGTLNAACTRSRVNDNIIAAFNQIQAATLSGNASQAEEGIAEALRNIRVSVFFDFRWQPWCEGVGVADEGRAAKLSGNASQAEEGIAEALRNIRVSASTTNRVHRHERMMSGGGLAESKAATLNGNVSQAACEWD